jgi:hypothetical protein
VTDTPRTEERVQFFGYAPDDGEEFVTAGFARGLERENNALQQKVSLQGLHLATLADAILGEDAPDRSDETLVATGCRMARENAALLLKIQDLELQNNAMRSTSRGKEVAKSKKLERENAALRADKERLDWLETLDCDSPWWVHIADSTNLRDAIDSAQNEAQP